MPWPDFSIITPSFRQLDWLTLCAHSIADQEGVRLEHIVQDAGSDGIQAWAEAAAQSLGAGVVSATEGELLRAERDGYTLRVYSERDEGMYDAVNRGLRKSHGALCAYLNCDEQYLPGALGEVFRAFRERPRQEVLFGDAILVDEDGIPFSYRRVALPTTLHTRLEHLGVLTCATFYRRSVVDSGHLFDPAWKTIGDAVWVHGLLKAGVRCARLPQPLAAFTFTGANLSAHKVALEEGERWKRMPDAPPRQLRPVAKLWHRVRKAFAGAYTSKHLSTRLFTPASPHRRVPFRVGHISFRWPKSFTDRHIPARMLEQAGPPRIAAVFGTFNRCKTARECLQKLEAQTRPPDRVVVVDNGSDDGTAEMLDAYAGRWKALHVVRFEDNQGNGAAVAAAARRALELGCDLVWILDDDSWPLPDALEVLMASYRSPQEIVGSLVLSPEDGDLTWPAMLWQRDKRGIEKERLATGVADLPPGNEIEVRGIWLGALISAHVFSRVGFPEADYFLRGEDEDFTYRIARVGFTARYLRTSVLEHPKPSALHCVTLFGRSYIYQPRIAPWKSYYAVRNQILLARKFSRSPWGAVSKMMGVAVLGLFQAVFQDDRLRVRIPLVLRGIADGVAGRSGKRVDPGGS